MDFPRHVYRHGTQTRVRGGGYDSLITNDADEFDAAIADGWTDDLQAAIEGPPPAPAAEPADDSPPTRAELEQKAHELGVEFAPQLGDKKLAERIAAALKAKAGAEA